MQGMCLRCLECLCLQMLAGQAKSAGRVLPAKGSEVLDYNEIVQHNGRSRDGMFLRTLFMRALLAAAGGPAALDALVVQNEMLDLTEVIAANPQTFQNFPERANFLLEMHQAVVWMAQLRQAFYAWKPYVLTAAPRSCPGPDFIFKLRSGSLRKVYVEFKWDVEQRVSSTLECLRAILQIFGSMPGTMVDPQPDLNGLSKEAVVCMLTAEAAKRGVTQAQLEEAIAKMRRKAGG